MPEDYELVNGVIKRKNLDNAAPVITIGTASPLSWEAGVPFVAPTATALDEVDGDLTASIQVAVNVNVNEPGDTYTVVYSVSDTAGNTASQTLAVTVTPSFDTGDPNGCLLYTSPSPRDRTRSRMPSSA